LTIKPAGLMVIIVLIIGFLRYNTLESSGIQPTNIVDKTIISINYGDHILSIMFVEMNSG
jgi:hypothetical protein